MDQRKQQERFSVIVAEKAISVFSLISDNVEGGTPVS
jgi:hypothetical protein